MAGATGSILYYGERGLWAERRPTQQREEEPRMARYSLAVWSTWYGRHVLAKPATRPRRARHRMIPGAEFLEVRDCPSGLTPSAEVHPLARVSLSAHRPLPLPLIHQDRYRSGAPLGKLAHKKAAANGPMTIYVEPGGKSGASAGRGASRPLGSRRRGDVDHPRAGRP